MSKLRDWINPEKLNWKHLSGNPNAIPMLEQNPEKISWDWLSRNPNAIHILEQNPEKLIGIGYLQIPMLFIC